MDFQEDNVQSFNRYAYANNNPYRYIDPDGRAPWDRNQKGINNPFGLDAGFGPGRGPGGKLDVGAGRINDNKSVSQIIDEQNTVLARELAKKVPHGNKVDGRPATLYEKYDKDGTFLKHGVTKREDPAERYTARQVDGGTVVRTDRGPRSEMIKKERDLVERSPGPDNRERWAGKRLGE